MYYFLFVFSLGFFAAAAVDYIFPGVLARIKMLGAAAVTLAMGWLSDLGIMG